MLELFAHGLNADDKLLTNAEAMWRTVGRSQAG
jgi:hypothetical protein